jgi:hypothetical protein
MLIAQLKSEYTEPSEWSFLKLDHSGDKLWEKTISFPQVTVKRAAPLGNDQFLLLEEYWKKSTTFADRLVFTKVTKPL